MPSLRACPPPARALAAMLAACAVAASAAGRAPVVTVLDGEATLLRDGGRYALAEGVRLQAGDLVATGPQARLLSIEFPAGPTLALGPASRAMLAPSLGDDGRHAGAYLLAGWVKLAAPAGVAGALRSPAVDTDTSGGTLILDVEPDAARAFAEAGPSQARPRAAGLPAQPLRPGELLTLAAGAKPAVAQGASPAFVQAMPRAFMDALPARLAAVPADVAPRRLGDMTYADAQPWIDAEPPLRRLFAERWRRLAADPPFRAGLVAGLKAHPEWAPVLNPPGRAAPGAVQH